MREEEEEDRLFIIRTFSRDVDARLAEAVLDAHGIECLVISDDGGGWLNYLNSLHPIRLAVAEADVEVAVRLLDAS